MFSIFVHLLPAMQSMYIGCYILPMIQHDDEKIYKDAKDLTQSVETSGRRMMRRVRGEPRWCHRGHAPCLLLPFYFILFCSSFILFYSIFILFFFFILFYFMWSRGYYEQTTLSSVCLISWFCQFSHIFDQINKI